MPGVAGRHGFGRITMGFGMEKGGFFPEGALGGQGTDGGAAHRAIEGFTEIGADGVIFRGPVVGTRPQFDPHGG